MEMKRINENTIRVLLNNEDLNERGITVLDLLNHNQQIEDFFYSILEEVERAITEIGNYNTYRLGEEEVLDIASNMDFVEWYIDQSARIASERVLTQQRSFWNDWCLSSGARRGLKKLNILEERILYLREGFLVTSFNTFDVSVESDILDGVSITLKSSKLTPYLVIIDGTGTPLITALA